MRACNYANLNQNMFDKQGDMAMGSMYDPWVLTNKLLEHIYLYIVPYDDNTKMNFLTDLNPDQSKSIKYDRLRAGDYILATIKLPLKTDACGKPEAKKQTGTFIATPSVVLNESRKRIDFGVIAYDSYGDTNITTLGISSDIPSFRIINHLTVPIDIIYDTQYAYLRENAPPRVVATIDADDGTNYMGGSSSNLFMTNGREGFKFGKTIQINIRNTNIVIANYKLVDNYIKNLHIGVTVANHIDQELAKLLTQSQYFSTGDSLIDFPSLTLGSIPNGGYQLPLNDRLSYSATGQNFHDVVYYKPIKNCPTDKYASDKYKSAKIGGLV